MIAMNLDFSNFSSFFFKVSISNLLLQLCLCQFNLQCRQIAMLLTQCCHIPVPLITSTQLLIEASNACKIQACTLVIFATSPLDAGFDICLINLDGLLRVAFFGVFGNLNA